MSAVLPNVLFRYSVDCTSDGNMFVIKRCDKELYMSAQLFYLSLDTSFQCAIYSQRK